MVNVQEWVRKLVYYCSLIELKYFNEHHLGWRWGDAKISTSKQL